MLILSERLLVKSVRLLKIVAREKQVAVKSVFAVGAVVYAVEDVGGRAAIMERSKFRRVEKATRALEVE